MMTTKKSKVLKMSISVTSRDRMISLLVKNDVPISLRRRMRSVRKITSATHSTMTPASWNSAYSGGVTLFSRVASYTGNTISSRNDMVT